MVRTHRFLLTFLFQFKMYEALILKSKGKGFYICLFVLLIFSQNANEQFLGEIFFDVPVVFWSISLGLLTYLEVSSAFVCALWVAFPLLTKLMIYKEFKEKGKREKKI